MLAAIRSANCMVQLQTALSLLLEAVAWSVEAVPNTGGTCQRPGCCSQLGKLTCRLGSCLLPVGCLNSDGECGERAGLACLTKKQQQQQQQRTLVVSNQVIRQHSQAGCYAIRELMAASTVVSP